MTLKEKIIDQVHEMPLEASPTQKDIDNYNLSINNLEKITDDFAIGFAEWFWVNKDKFYKGERDYYLEFNELLQIYKKEKGL